MDLDLLLCDLEDPWRSRARALLQGVGDGPALCWEHYTILAGTFWSQVNDIFEVSLMQFVAGQGFTGEKMTEAKICIHDAHKRSLNLIAGDPFVCAGLFTTQDIGLWTGDHRAILLKKTMPVLDEAIECLRIFSGAFSGWGQALSSLPRFCSTLRLGTQTFVDVDVEVTAALARKHGCNVTPAPVQASAVFEVSLHKVVRAEVADPCLLHVVQPLANFIFTASPPCISWSRGGLGRGLNCFEGWTFVDCLKQCAFAQPTMLNLECVDELARHAHFPIIRRLLHVIGYRALWEGTLPYCTFAHMQRTRWLAVYVRADLFSHVESQSDQFRAFRFEQWTSDAFRFQLPRSLREKITIPQSIQVLYGLHSLLPPSKRMKIAPDMPSEAIIRSRYLQSHEPVPTVCASYGFQHELPRSCLEQKGIFATLREGDFGPEFLDPALLAGLLGLLETSVFSSKLDVLYRQIGNAIATPHALFVLLQGFKYLFQWPTDVVQIVNEVWTTRLTGPRTVIIEEGNFYIFASTSTIIDDICVRSEVTSHQECLTIHCIHQGGRATEFPASRDWSVNDLLGCFTWDFSITGHIYLAATGETLSPRARLWQVFDQYPQWTVFLQGFPVATIQLASKAPLVCPSTQPWPGPDGQHSNVLQPLDQTPTQLLLVEDQVLFEDRHFHFALEYLENHCLDAPSLGTADMTIAFGSLPCTITLPGLSHEADRLRCVHEFWAFADGDSNQLAFKLNDHSHSASVGPCAVIFNKYSDDKLIFVIFENGGSLCGFFLAPSLENCSFEIDSKLYMIAALNGQEVSNYPVLIDHGDLLQLRIATDVSCGGHHGARTDTLPAGANLIQRAEFASNTGGWLATDEMDFALRQFSWLAPEFAVIHPIVRWNLETANLEENDYQEIMIANNRLNVLPILSGSHWLAFEIQRDGATTHVTFVGLPGPLLRSGLQVVARLLDISPDRLQYSHVPLDDSAHFCGWALLHRWANAAGIFEQIPHNAELYGSTSIAMRALIDDVVEDAIEDWHQHGIAHGLWYFAANIRRAFFSFLATTTIRGNAVTSDALHVVFDDAGHSPDHAETPFIHIDSPDSHLHHRIQHFNHYPGWLGSDELDFILHTIRFVRPQCCFMPPGSWDYATGHIVYFNDVRRDFRAYQHVTWFVLIDQCWTQIDANRNDASIALFMSLPDALAHLAGPLATFIMSQIDEAQLTCQVHIIRCNPEANMCGWVLLHSLCERLRIAIPTLANETQQAINLSRFRVHIRSTIERARLVWQLSSSFPRISNFAALVRTNFLHHLLADRGVPQYAAGGGTEHKETTNKSEAGATKVDQLQIDDPWAPKTGKQKNPKKLFQTRWEDLTMPADHPLIDEKGIPIPQVHRLQAGAKKAGAVLATKSGIAELSRITPCATMLAILPGNDKNQYIDLGLKVIGPYELVLEDAQAKTAYKRLVILWQLHGSVTYKLPDPKVQLTAAEVAELVMDADSRLLGPQDTEQASQQHISFLKHHFGLLHPDLIDKVNMYAFRVGRHPSAGKDDKNFQCIIKVPVTCRPTILKSSGSANFLFRDYLTNADTFEDITVLPRFWEPKQSSLHEVYIMTKGTSGYAGACLTRRGLAARAWTANVAEMRKAILSADSRITAENISVIPKFTYQTTGWPASTEPRDVITATLKATGLPPLPSRAFRSNGVCGWTMAFQKRPSIAKFSVEVNGKLHEILLVEEILTGQAKPPGRSSGKKVNDPPRQQSRAEPAIAPQYHAENIRLDRLEEKFSVLEGRQSRMEAKFDSRFDDISSSLRQLLHAANVPRDRSPTGETPAPKHQRGPGPY